MKLIVGLGNPGEKYELTRHNLGFMVVEQFLKDFQPVEKTVWSNEKNFKCDIARLEWQPKEGNSEKVILVKPKTFMNNSGDAVSLLASFYKIDPQDIWIIYDDLDLPLGHMKIRFGGASGGHHGVDSVITLLGTDKFWRFRLGIGQSLAAEAFGEEEGMPHNNVGRQKLHDGAEYVLSIFPQGETQDMKKLVTGGSEAIQVALEKGLQTAQNRFNA